MFCLISDHTDGQRAERSLRIHQRRWKSSSGVFCGSSTGGKFLKRNFQVAGAVWGAWMDGWMERIHVLGSSADPFLLVFTWQFCCSGAVPFLLCRCFSCSCAGFVPSLEAGLTPTVMARFWMVGGGLEVFELGDLK